MRPWRRHRPSRPAAGRQVPLTLTQARTLHPKHVRQQTVARYILNTRILPLGPPRPPEFVAAPQHRCCPPTTTPQSPTAYSDHAGKKSWGDWFVLVNKARKAAGSGTGVAYPFVDNVSSCSDAGMESTALLVMPAGSVGLILTSASDVSGETRSQFLSNLPHASLSDRPPPHTHNIPRATPPPPLLPMLQLVSFFCMYAIPHSAFFF